MAADEHSRALKAFSAGQADTRCISVMMFVSVGDADFKFRRILHGCQDQASGYGAETQ